MAYSAWSVVAGEQPSAAKWNILGSNDASFNDGTGIGDGVVFPVHLAAGLSDSTWAWQAWTPTLSGRLDDADWTKDCKYIQIGKTVFFRLSLIATAAAPMGGGTSNAIFTLPVTAATIQGTDGRQIIGQAWNTDDNGSSHVGVVGFGSTTTGIVYSQLLSTTAIILAAIASTAPFTWTSNDEISAIGTYEAA